MAAVLKYMVIIISGIGNIAEEFCLQNTVVCLRSRQGVVNSVGEQPETSSVFCLPVTSVHLVQHWFFFFIATNSVSFESPVINELSI